MTAIRKTTLITKNSDVVNRPLPNTGILLNGEAIVNTAEGILYYKGASSSTNEWTPAGAGNDANFFEVGSNLYDLKLRNRITSYEGLSDGALVGKFLSGTSDGFVLADISDIEGIDTFVTGFTYDDANTITVSRNQGQPDLSVNISTMTGLTVNGDINATNFLSGGTNILDIVNSSDTFVTGGTINGGDLTLTNNDGDSFTVSGLNTGYTFSNGLTELNGDVTFGGTLDGDTDLNLNGNQLQFGGGSSVAFFGNQSINFGGQQTLSFVNGGGDITFAGFDNMTLSSNNTDATQRGVNYFADYSTSWNGSTPDSILATKGYVDRTVSDIIASGVTASNGLTEVGGDIQLGGTLTQDTNIQSNTELFTITSDNGTDNAQFYIKSDDGVALYANSASDSSSIEMGPSNLDIDAKNSSWGGEYIGFNLTDDFEITAAQFVYSDAGVSPANRIGMYYSIDYSTGWDGSTPDSILTTKGYVDRTVNDIIASGVTASNGLTEVGGDIQLGGALTQATTISLSGNNISTIGTGNESILFDNADELLVNNITNVEFNFGSQFVVGNGFSSINLESTDVLELQSDSFRLRNDVGGETVIDAAFTRWNGEFMSITLTDDFELESNSFTYTDAGNVSNNQRGMYYTIDYSTDWDSNTLDSIIATKGYVDRQISGVSTDTFVTDMTYLPSSLTLVRNEGQPDLNVVIDSVTGLTVGSGGSVGTPGTGDLVVHGNIISYGEAISAFTGELYIEDNNIILNYNPDQDTTSSSLGAGITIQDGSGVAGVDTALNIASMQTLVGITVGEDPDVSEYTGLVGNANRGLVTQVSDIVIRSTDDATPNGVRVLAEFDVLDGGSY